MAGSTRYTRSYLAGSVVCSRCSLVPVVKARKGGCSMNVPLSSQWIDASDKSAVLDVLRSDHLSLGPRLPEFEEGLARVADVAHGVAVNSGTSALHLIVRSLGLTEGDEVVTTPFSFIASSNCLLFEHVKPVFVDLSLIHISEP